MKNKLCEDIVNFNKKNDKGAALYIHIPFCMRKCLYCDFFSFAADKNLMDEYISSLCTEIKRFKNIKIKSIFIGGGTPTCLNVNELDALANAILVLNAQNVEFTMECNPGTLNMEKLKIIRKMGVNRLSIGLQAWQDRLLKKLGRIHSRDDFIKSYDMARSAGINNINVDIMFGLPEQTLNDWGETIDNVLSLKPQHISCYSLIIEEGTPFYELYGKNRLAVPDEDTERKMYALGVEKLKKEGYNQYEISNFSLKGYECRHNLVYWSLQPYIGLGAGAHSYVNNLRFKNTQNIEEYIQCMNNNLQCMEDIHENSKKDNMEEYVFTGLRKINGISISEFYSRFEEDIFKVYGTVIEKYLSTQHLDIEGDRLFLTYKGIEISNYVMSDFILD